MYKYTNFQKGQKATALGYNKKEDIAPKMLSSGKGFVAQKIIEIAKEHNIPLYENAELVEILSLIEVNEYIPMEVYAIVAEIFSYIYEENEKKIIT
jgi:flagellar biosynthesis protein